MARQLTVVAILAFLLLWSHDRAEAQTIGRPIGSGGGFGAGPVGPLGGGSVQEPLGVSADPITPSLGGTLPDIQTPEVELPPSSEPAIAVNGQAVERSREEPTLPPDTATISQSDDHYPSADVSSDDTLRDQDVTAGGAPGHEDKDNDDDDGDTPWWVWLLVVIGVAIVASWLRR